MTNDLIEKYVAPRQAGEKEIRHIVNRHFVEAGKGKMLRPADKRFRRFGEQDGTDCFFQMCLHMSLAGDDL